MDDYISREALKEAFEKIDVDVPEGWKGGRLCNGFGREVVNEVIDSAPSVNVEPVVRCKDCKEWGDEAGVTVRTDGVRFARCKVHSLCVRGKMIGWCPTENDFCSYGERKEGADND